jgi:nucleoside-diphosphate-sugar epimerase
VRVFVTGASGWVGSAVVKDLLAAGYSVLGMSRSDAGAATVAAAGAEVYRGNLEDPESLRRGAAESDGVIHTAFSHDFSRFAQNGEDEKRALAVLANELAGSGRPLIVTSGAAFLRVGRVATEDDTVPIGAHAVPRDPETPAMLAAQNGVRAALIRLSPSVHGTGDKGFVAMLIGIAREKGTVAYIGEGNNYWPAVHRLDAARLYRLALENGEASKHYHAVAEEGVRFRDIATALSKGLDLPLVSIAPEKAAEHFGWFANFAAIDVQVSSARTQSELGWTPAGHGLIADIEMGHYFGR